MALPLELRIKGRRAFDEFRTKGRFVSNRDISLKFVDETESRAFAFSVPKRLGCAVKRNRIRRVLSENVRLNLDSFPDRRHYLVIVKTKCSERELVAQLLEIAGGLI